VIFSENVPISDDARRLAEKVGASNLESAALRHALSDGQDFELLIAVAPDIAQSILRDKPLDCPVTHVGELVPEAGLWQQNKTRQRTPLEPLGWVHS
jgi:thiamine-monophosphate kinase